MRYRRQHVRRPHSGYQEMDLQWSAASRRAIMQ